MPFCQQLITKSKQPQPGLTAGTLNFPTFWTESPQNALIGNITVREDCRWTDQAILHSKISSKSWPLAVKSPTQSLDYRANSYHIHLNTLGFHRCGKEISQICPCPFCSINTSFSGTLLPSCHSIAPNPPSWWRHRSRTSSTPARASSNNPPSLWFSSLLRKKWPSASSSLRLTQHPLSLFTIFLSYSYSSVNLFTEYVFFSFFCPFDLQTL